MSNPTNRSFSDDREALQFTAELDNAIAQFPQPDRQALEIVAHLNTALGDTVNATAVSIDANAVCDTYRNVRPWLERFLPFIGGIPVIGGTLAAAIRVLMTIADLYCGANR